MIYILYPKINQVKIIDINAYIPHFSGKSAYSKAS
jgi:hypothetical protein